MLILPLCLLLSFLYILLYWFVKKLNIKPLIEYHTYLWAITVLLISLFYEGSFIRRSSFTFLNTEFLKNFVIFSIGAVVAARYSGYPCESTKQNIHFIVVFPIFEEILFRGTILPLLLSMNLANTKWAFMLCALLFGVMHFQYFGLKASAIRKVVIAALGGYCFSILTYRAGSILPAVGLHMLFNGAAVGFAIKSSKVN